MRKLICVIGIIIVGAARWFGASVYKEGDLGEKVSAQNPNGYFDIWKTFQAAKGQYIDAHKWLFTPPSFYEIIEKLYAMGLSPFVVERIFCTHKNSHEFYAILYKP